MERELLDWSMSATMGGVTEIAVMAPIIRGRAPGERLTYEEKLRRVIESIANRAERGIPHQLNTISSIHFGRMMIIRPEQYLTNSRSSDVSYYDAKGRSGAPQGNSSVPKPMDEFEISVLGADGNVIDAGAKGQYRHFRCAGLPFLASDDRILRRGPEGLFQGYRTVPGARFRRCLRINCVDFPSTQDFEKFWQWIRRYQVPVDLFLCAYPDLYGGAHQATGGFQALLRCLCRQGAFADRPQGREHGMSCLMNSCARPGNMPPISRRPAGPIV